MLSNTSFIEKIGFRQILFVALILRLVAAFFSQGYSHHDDHFLVVEVAEAWTDGVDVADWFVDDFEENTSGRSVLYPGVHYVLFQVLDTVGITALKSKMLITRILHVFYSLLIVVFAYRLTKLYGTEGQAKVVAIILSILWIMPNISVRSLTEVVAIPPLLIASYLTLKNIKTKDDFLSYLFSGLLFGIAFSLRYQVAVFIIGFVLGLAIWKNWKAVLIISVSGIIYFIGFHGYGDYLMCGIPFGKVIYYVDYNLKFASDYIRLPWYNHLLVVAGFLVPPLGIYLLIGTFKTKKEYLPMFLGVIIFLVIHSAMKGKQERFMYTMFPFFVILGYLGWSELKQKIRWKGWPKFEKGSWIFAFCVNTIALVFLTTWYGKEARVEVMHYFQDKKVNKMIVANEIQENTANMLPRGYSGQWFDVIEFRKDRDFEKFSSKINNMEIKPNYLLFEVKPGVEKYDYVNEWKSLFPNMKIEARIYGSPMDKWHYNANPVVKNYSYVVYKLQE